MGGLVNLFVCVLAAGAFYGTGHPILFWLSIGAGVVAFWSWGIMHNYAMEPAISRHDLIIQNMRDAGRSEDDISRFDSRIISPGRADANAIPNWLATVNMVATLVGVVLLIWGSIVRFL